MRIRISTLAILALASSTGLGICFTDSAPDVSAAGVSTVVVSTTSPVLSVVTSEATNITQAGAIIGGTVTMVYGDYIAAVAVSPSSAFSEPVYSYSGACNPDSQVTISRHQKRGDFSAQAISVDLTTWNASCLLQPGVRYYYKVGVQASIYGSCLYDISCYTWGNTESFVTRAAVLPSATTGEASDVGPDSAKLSASVSTTDGTAAVKFEYGLSPTLAGAKSVDAGSLYPNQSSGSVGQYPGHKAITGLIEESTYYYRVVASTIYGTSRGLIKSFTTRAPVGVSVNNADDYTNGASVTLSVSWPNGAETMLVSNDGGFRQQKSFALSDSIPWTLVSSGDERLPKTVYLKFVMSDGTRSSTYSDDIILDTTAPVVTQASAVSVNSSTGVSISAVRKNAVKLSITSSDSNSGIDHLEVKSGAGRQPVSVPVLKVGKVKTSVVLKTSKKSFLVRAIDRAGNPSTKWVKVAAKG